MRILKMDIKGFRSLKDISWETGDLNVVIGPNGSGKPTLLRILELISISAQGQLGKYVQRAGGIEPLLWDGSADSINFLVKTSPVEEDRDIEQDSLTYEVKLNRIGKSTSYKIGHEILGNYHRVVTGKSDQPFKFLEREGLKAIIFDKNEEKLIAQEETIDECETLMSEVGGPFTENKYISQYRNQLASWSVYHDLHVNHDAVIRQATTTRNEKRVDPDGQNLISVLHTLYTGDRNFKADINKAMRIAFGDDFEELVFYPAADQKIQLCVRWKSLKHEQSAADFSDGTLRFLFLLTVLASPSPAPVIAIDEPETGLHPSMLPIVAEYASEASRRSQVIFTTHSPQFLDAFGDIRPATTVTKWRDGETVLLRLDEKQLSKWLKEYSLGSLFESGELEGME